MRASAWLLTAGLALSTLACGSSPNPAAPVPGPTIEQVLPARAAVGDTVTIIGSGFLASGNGVKIGSGYLLNVPSSGGTFIQFMVPAYLGVCPPGPAVCIQIALELAPGDYQMAVVNDRGTSNAASFQVVKKAGS